MFAIELSRSAAADLVALRAFERARIVAEIRAELATSPTSPGRNKKMLRELRPAWEHVPPLWQLRIGEHRAFYDVDEAQRIVYVRRVVRKGSKTTGEIV
jgi:mRNA-degrading endonuclease RelE of RelBE toxin-antitoxin system